MLLATILLLCPLPQIEGTGKVAEAPAAISTTAKLSELTNSAGDSTKDSTKDSSLTLPSAPEPKVKSDAEVEPGYTPAAASSFHGAKMSMTRPTESRTQRRLWYALSFTGSGAAAFDAWSTRRAISGGYGTESNPLLRPFAHSNAMYAATQVSPLVMDFLGKRMMVSQHKWIRSLWWVPQSAGTGVSLYAGVHNTRLVP